MRAPAYLVLSTLLQLAVLGADVVSAQDRNGYLAIVPLPVGAGSGSETAKRSVFSLMSELRKELGSAPPEMRGSWSAENNWKEIVSRGFDFYLIAQLTVEQSSNSIYSVTWQLGDLPRRQSGDPVPVFVGNLRMKTRILPNGKYGMTEGNDPPDDKRELDVGSAAKAIFSKLRRVLPDVQPPNYYFVVCWRDKAKLAAFEQIVGLLTSELWDDIRDANRIEPAEASNDYRNPSYTQQLCTNTNLNIYSGFAKADFLVQGWLEEVPSSADLIVLAVEVERRSEVSRRQSDMFYPLLPPFRDEVRRYAQDSREPRISVREFCTTRKELVERSTRVARNFSEYVRTKLILGQPHSLGLHNCSS